jgi:hypothetical protein
MFLRRFLCRASTAQATLPIGAYINDLYACDKTLVQMIQKTEMEILRVTKLGSSKHVAKRRIMLKRHKASIEGRRDNILARILQLEALHINNMQIDALKGVTRAFKGSKYTIGDVDQLLDKLEDFKEDFEAINERLSEDISFQNADIDEEELLAELQQLENKDRPSIQSILTSVPEPPLKETALKETPAAQVHTETASEENEKGFLPALS